MIGMFGRTLFYVGIVGAALWVGWMLADRTPPYIYDADQSRVIPDPATQNSMVTADWAIKHINRTCPGSVQRFFTDKTTGKVVATLDTTPVSRAIHEGDTNLPRSFMLPPKLPPIVGYRAELCFQCNLLQHISPLCFMTPELTLHIKQ